MNEKMTKDKKGMPWGTTKQYFYLVADEYHNQIKQSLFLIYKPV